MRQLLPPAPPLGMGGLAGISLAVSQSEKGKWRKGTQSAAAVGSLEAAGQPATFPDAHPADGGTACGSLPFRNHLSGQRMDCGRIHFVCLVALRCGSGDSSRRHGPSIPFGIGDRACRDGFADRNRISAPAGTGLGLPVRCLHCAVADAGQQAEATGMGDGSAERCEIPQQGGLESDPAGCAGGSGCDRLAECCPGGDYWG